MGSVATTFTDIKEQGVSLDDAGSLETFIAPDGRLLETGSSAIDIQAGDDVKLTQSITGITGGDANAMLANAFDTSLQSQSQVVSLAQTALGELSDRAEASESLAANMTNSNYQSWLPYLLIGVVAVIYLGAR